MNNISINLPKKEPMYFKSKIIENIPQKKITKKPKSLLFNLNKKNTKRKFGKDIKNIKLLSHSKKEQCNYKEMHFNNKKRKRDKSNEDTEISSKLNELIENKENIPNINYTSIITTQTTNMNNNNNNIIKNSDIKLNIINNNKNKKNDEIQTVKEYIDEIYHYLKTIESENIIPFDYLTKKQPEINSKMRTILINWIIEVHYKFHLLNETLFICVKILDKYLSQKTIERKYLQLLGITSLYISAKYEEIYAPSAKDLIYMTDNAYSKEDMIRMESDILNVINFNICIPSSLRFVEIYENFLNLDLNNSYNLYRVFYLNELSLLNYNIIKYSPSLIACTCLFLNLKTYNGINTEYNEEKLFKISGYNYQDIYPCLCELINILKIINDPEKKFISIKKKYALDKYMKVSNDNYIISI